MCRAVLALVDREGRPRSGSPYLLFNVPGNGDSQNGAMMQKATSILLCERIELQRTNCGAIIRSYCRKMKCKGEEQSILSDGMAGHPY